MAKIIDLSDILGRERPGRRALAGRAAGQAVAAGRTVAETIDAIRGAAATAMDALDMAAFPDADSETCRLSIRRYDIAVSELLSEIAEAEASGTMAALARSFRRGGGA